MRYPDGLILLIAVSLTIARAEGAPPGADGLLALEVVQSEGAQPIAARISLKNSRGRPVVPRGVGMAAWSDHFYVDGSVALPLNKGVYTFGIEAGLEFKPQSGHFDIERHADDSKRISMSRFVDLASEGWQPADLLADRAATLLDVALRAEGLKYVPLVAYHWRDAAWKRAGDSKLPEAKGVLVERSVLLIDTPGGQLVCIAPATLDEPPEWRPRDGLAAIVAAKKSGYVVLAASSVEWELPAWLATGKVDGILLHADQRPRPNQRPGDRISYGGNSGPGRWQEAAYFQMLEAGFKLPPMAGSGSGLAEVPLGTSFVLVSLAGDFDRRAWWRQALAGANVVSTGPLLRPQVGGDPPGQVFATSADNPVEFAVALNLATRTSIEYLEILRNGQVEHEVRLDDWAAAGGKLPPLEFSESGWFAIRAVTTNRDRYDVAMSAPYYVETTDGARISQAACDFFLEWLDELAELPVGRRSIADNHLQQARQIWQQRRAASNSP